MKKNLLIVVLLFAAVFSLCAQNGVIRELTGVVELKPAGASAFTAARPGSVVAQNTVISTGFKSTAIIAVGSSLITVRPLTRLTLAEISSAEGTEKLNVALQTGRVKVDVKPAAGTKTACTVQGPSATASVRGTSFEFDSRNIRVSEGVVSFRGNAGAAIQVSAGGTGYVGNDGKAVNPAETEGYLPPAPVGVDSGTDFQPAASAGAGKSAALEVTVQYQ